MTKNWLLIHFRLNISALRDSNNLKTVSLFIVHTVTPSIESYRQS